MNVHQGDGDYRDGVILAHFIGAEGRDATCSFGPATLTAVLNHVNPSRTIMLEHGDHLPTHAMHQQSITIQRME